MAITWYEALGYCENTIDTTLASIHDDNDNIYALLAVEATEYAPSYDIIRYAWFGYNDLDNNGFEYTDGSANDYTNWQPGQPNSINQDCGQLSGWDNLEWEGRWNDDDCYRRETYAFVCNKPI